MRSDPASGYLVHKASVLGTIPYLLIYEEQNGKLQADPSYFARFSMSKVYLWTRVKVVRIVVVHKNLPRISIEKKSN